MSVGAIMRTEVKAGQVIELLRSASTELDEAAKLVRASGNAQKLEVAVEHTAQYSMRSAAADGLLSLAQEQAAIAIADLAPMVRAGIDKPSEFAGAADGLSWALKGARRLDLGHHSDYGRQLEGYLSGLVTELDTIGIGAALWRPEPGVVAHAGKGGWKLFKREQAPAGNPVAADLARTLRASADEIDGNLTSFQAAVSARDAAATVGLAQPRQLAQSKVAAMRDLIARLDAEMGLPALPR